MQAVSGIVLAAIGLWYDDYKPSSSPSPVTPDLLSVYTYKTGIEKNDTALLTYFGQPRFPYMQIPWSGKTNCDCGDDQAEETTSMRSFSEKSELSLAPPEIFATSAPNPMVNKNTLRYKLDEEANVQVSVFDASGKLVKTLRNAKQSAGIYSLHWQAEKMTKGVYFLNITKNGELKQSIRVIKE